MIPSDQRNFGFPKIPLWLRRTAFGLFVFAWIFVCLWAIQDTASKALLTILNWLLWAALIYGIYRLISWLLWDDEAES